MLAISAFFASGVSGAEIPAGLWVSRQVDSLGAGPSVARLLSTLGYVFSLGLIGQIGNSRLLVITRVLLPLRAYDGSFS